MNGVKYILCSLLLLVGCSKLKLEDNRSSRLYYEYKDYVKVEYHERQALYDINKHKIELKSFNKKRTIMHEYGHFIDNILGIRLYNEDIYASSVGEFKKEVDKLILDHSGVDLSYDKSMLVRDMINLMTSGSLMNTREDGYWIDYECRKYTEAFANIFAMETLGLEKDLQWVEKNMPNVLREYYKLLR